MNKLIKIIYFVVMVVLANINHVSTGKSLNDSPLVLYKNKKSKREVKPRLTIAERIQSIPNSNFQVCGGIPKDNKYWNSPKAPTGRIIGGNPKNVGVLSAQRQNEKYVTVGNSVKQKTYKMIPETELNPTKKENYTSYFSFSRAEQNIKHSKKALKPLNIIFNRLIFDIDSEDNLDSALISARNVVQFFKDNFPELYIETYFSGSKGYHIYVFFEPIEVDNPEKIVKHITNVLKETIANRIDPAITDIYSRKIRAPASRNNKSGLYKVPVNLDESSSTHKKNAKKNIKTLPVEKYNKSESFTNFILQLDEQLGARKEAISEFKKVHINDTLHETFGKYFVEGQMNTLGWRLIHCFKRAKTSKEDVIQFFNRYSCDHVEVSKWIDRAYDTELDRLGGINALKMGLEEVGAKPQDIQIICGYFKSTVKGEEALNDVIYCLGERKRVDYGQSQLANFLTTLGINGRFGMDVYYRKTENTGFCKIDDSDVYRLINPKIGFNLRSKDLTNAKDYLNSMPDPNYDIILFNNGQYNIRTHTFNPESDPEIFSLLKIPYDYNPEAESTLFKKYFETSLPNYELDDLLEVFGYYFTQGNSQQVILFLTGRGGAGKSTLTNILDGVFDGQTCNVDISLYNERFQRAPFVEAQLNLIGEADTTTKHLARNYKEYTGNTPIQIEKKGLDPFTLPAEEIPKTIQACNNIPDIDFDTPTLERFLVIEYKHGFRGTESKIPDLDKKILSNPEEIEWFIYHSLEAWKNFNGQFKIQGSVRDTETQVICNNNPIIPFLETYTQDYNNDVPDKFGFVVESRPVGVTELEEEVKSFCDREGYNLETTKTGKLKKNLVKEAMETVYNNIFPKKRDTARGERKYSYEGLYWKDN